MCGIVAVLAAPAERRAADASDLIDPARRAAAILAGADPGAAAAELVPQLDEAARILRDLDGELRGSAGLASLLADPAAARTLAAEAEDLGDSLKRLDESLDPDGTGLEQVNASLIALKDAWWAVARDRLGLAASVGGMLGDRATQASAGNLTGWWSVAVALASIDRLEVRGRDSAGVHVMVTGHGIDPAEIGDRTRDALLRNGSVRLSGSTVSFIYKAAAEIGELGDNVRALRAAISADGLLARAMEAPGARTTVIAHTRWASVGIISEPNAHPVDSLDLSRGDTPYVAAVLNGDVDNHIELRQEEGLLAPPEVTTDAKVIPALMGRRMAGGTAPDDAFLETVVRFHGSVAIAASAAATPDQLHLALAGSGQSLYIGLAEDAFVVASEPYGLVEETNRYVRMDGESHRGQVAVLDRAAAGRLEGITSRRYGGQPIAIGSEDVKRAEITTRDIDRRGFDHFLLKEISESPASFRKTLRGRMLADGEGRLSVALGPDVLPPETIAAFRDARLRRAIVIGQGTAAVAGSAVAAALRYCVPQLAVRSMPATELSGFGLADDMSDTLIVAISQSGTTTDTNRTVDLARGRGAHVIAVVNRRNSDLAAKSHGVLHTSDGRDVEMSVASTKAFYAQVAAGWLLAFGLAQVAGSEPDQALLAALRDLPSAMTEVLDRRAEIGRIAAALAPRRKFWAVVGSGPDHIAASEVRIKLSELCYRSISADTTEDKKHIDLSCEPLILVCAGGLSGPTADDAAKEVAIYRAHKAAPVVVAAAGEEERFRAVTPDVVTVPRTEAVLAFVLSAMVGHLFGYEAALAIDAQGRQLRAVRGVIENAGSGGGDLLETLAEPLAEASAPFRAALRDGALDGNLEASTAVRLVSLLSYATGALPLEGYERETGKVGSPATLLTDLLDALTEAVDQLTRPVDAIKHQAKTVTVGISRSEDELFGVPLVSATLAAGPAPDALGYRALRTLAALDRAVAEVLGYTRYRIDWTPPEPTAAVIDQGGVARGLRSRTETDPRLRGSKHRAADEREVTVVCGVSDGRTVVLVPEVKGVQVTGMTLLHVRLHEFLPAPQMAEVLAGYRTRYNALADAVTETEASFDTERLGSVPVADLLTRPVYELAERWRSRSG